MPKKPEHALAEELASILRRLKAVEAKPKLARSSIDDGRLVTKDRDGVVREIIGRQEDGSHGSRVVVSPPQPAPSAPVLSAGEAAVVSVRWDGEADGAVPLVHGRVDVLAAHIPEGQEPVFSQAEVVSSIRDRDGGGTAFAADQAGTWAVWLVMVGQDRVTRSEPSEVSTLVVSMPVDGAAIEAELEQAKQDLADAEAEWEQARQGLRSDLDTLNNTTIPALESDLSTAQQNVDTIQNTTIPAVEQNLSDAEAAWEQSKTDLQDGLGQINNETIPVIRDDVDANATAITQAAQDAQAEYDRLQEIAEQALAGAPNVIYDPSFETDWYQLAWGGENDLSVTTNSPGSTEPTEGLQVLRASNDTGGTVAGELNFTPVSRKGDTPTNAVADLSMSVRPGEVWRFEVDVRALAAGFDGTMRLRCMKADSFQTVENFAFTPGQSWETYTLDVTIPQGITSVYWRFQPTVNSGGFFADRVSVRNVTDFKAALDAAAQAEQAAQQAHTEAGEARTIAEAARDTANQASRILSSTEPPTGTADEGVRWEQYEDFTSWKLIGTWIMQGGSWQKTELDSTYIPLLDASVISTGKLGAARIDVASLYADTGFIDAFHAETVEAMRVTAETGFIGGVHLADNSVGARQVIASEVGAEVGTFVEIDAGQIITGKLGAARIDVQSLFANQAFVNNFHAETVEAMRVTSEKGFIGGVLLEEGAVTAREVTASETLTAKIAEFLEVKAVHMTANSVTSAAIEAGAVTAAKINVSDLVASTAFVDSLAATELTIKGTFQTEYANGSGATISRGDVTYWSVEQGGFTTVQGTPYIRLTPRGGEKDRDPVIATDGQRLVLAPGQNSDGAAMPVMVDGRLYAAVVEAADEVGTSQIRLYDGEVGTIGDQSGFISSTTVSLSSGDETAYLDTKGVTFSDSSLGRRWGIQRAGVNGQNLEIFGELRPNSKAQDTFTVGATGWNDVDPGQGIRGSVTYGTPAQAGRRIVQLTPKVSSGTWTNYNSTSLAVSSDDASGFAWSARAPSNNSGSFSFRVVYTTIWGPY